MNISSLRPCRLGELGRDSSHYAIATQLSQNGSTRDCAQGGEQRTWCSTSAGMRPCKTSTAAMAALIATKLVYCAMIQAGSLGLLAN